MKGAVLLSRKVEETPPFFQSCHSQIDFLVTQTFVRFCVAVQELNNPVMHRKAKELKDLKFLDFIDF